MADVFYLYLTTYFWRFGRWNAPMRLHRYTNRTSIRAQASIFAGVGRLHAPHYRQATLYTFFDKEHPASKPAIDMAYSDVKAAFQYYLAHYNHGRPFILAGHHRLEYRPARHRLPALPRPARHQSSHLDARHYQCSCRSQSRQHPAEFQAYMLVHYRRPKP
jgi:hypothetical protein